MKLLVIFLVICAAILILCLILTVIAVIGDFHILEQCAGIGFYISFMVFLTIIAIMSIYTPNYEPTAIDVYRGKTTLEITYRDSAAVDSVVVYEQRVFNDSTEDYLGSFLQNYEEILTKHFGYQKQFE